MTKRVYIICVMIFFGLVGVGCQPIYPPADPDVLKAEFYRSEGIVTGDMFDEYLQLSGGSWDKDAPVSFGSDFEYTPFTEWAEASQGCDPDKKPIDLPCTSICRACSFVVCVDGEWGWETESQPGGELCDPPTPHPELCYPNNTLPWCQDPTPTPEPTDTPEPQSGSEDATSAP